MTTQLRGLIARARGAVDASARRIEPLLAPRYASGIGADATIREVQMEEGASGRSRVAPIAMLAPSALAPSAQQRSRAATQEGRMLLPRRTEVKQPSLASQPAHPTMSAPPSSIDAEREERGPQDAPSAAATVNAERGIAQSHEAREAAGQREAVPPRTQNSDFVRDVVPQTLRERVIERMQGSTPESAPAVSISIGRIDVHAPPAAAPAPTTQRRPAFRPGVSLDAFLRRGGGDDR